jgi:hypothetical protein
MRAPVALIGSEAERLPESLAARGGIGSHDPTGDADRPPEGGPDGMLV